jgi:hypothetical protein
MATLAAALSQFAHITEEAPKTASALHMRDDHPTSNQDLQTIVGDADDQVTSTFAQFGPNPGNAQLVNENSPISGDDVFWLGCIAGAKFQDKNGQQWVITHLDFDGNVVIENVWYPRLTPHVSIYDIRRSIYAWIEPIQQVVPEPPAGYDYGALRVKDVTKGN